MHKIMLVDNFFDISTIGICLITRSGRNLGCFKYGSKKCGVALDVHGEANANGDGPANLHV